MRCKICNGTANRIFSGHPGYLAPSTFDIWDCPECDTHFADPMRADDRVYELLYRHAERVPGYDRYKRYADMLPKSADPLGYMAAQEDVYWAIKTTVDQYSAAKSRPLRILEVGSGFGYLTHALNRSGHDCFGIDISTNAVTKAIADFGPHYAAIPLERFADPAAPPATSGYDAIIATEVIEHLPDPKLLIASAKPLLRPGGVLILTTPNKDLYSDRLAWHTDAAPVHFWWFSRTSLRRLAWDHALTAAFLDFAPFYGIHHGPVRGQSKPQTFNEYGDVIYKDTLVNTAARRLLAAKPELFKVLGKVFIRKTAAAKQRDALYRDSLSHCVVMTRPE